MDTHQDTPDTNDKPSHDPARSETPQPAQPENPLSANDATCRVGDSEIEKASHSIFSQIVHARGAALNQGPFESPTIGSTVSLGDLPIQLTHGEFKAYAFESMIDRSHLIAVTLGDITTEEPLLIRIHSECITSETLGGCDCDCVEQLDGALERIAEEGRGILFYLRQEGRGAGYSSKGRDRMAVCASNNTVETFEAYRELGLPADARRYENLSDVFELLALQAPLKVMTNNPDKIAGLEGLGFEVAERCPLVIPPNPFNRFYLETKGNNGHTLQIDGEGSATENGAYPWKVEAFTPHRLQGAARFTHNASYPLPIRPTDGQLVLNPERLATLKQIERELGKEIITGVETLSHGKFSVELNQRMVAAVIAEDLNTPLAHFIAENPHWFNDHIYRDSKQQWDYVVLTHETDPKQVPLVRVHSESLFERFPLREDIRSTKYEQSVQAIAEHGRGMVILYPEDGRGKGFGLAFMEKRLVNIGEAANTEEASELLGLQPDMRRYEGVAQLIRHHYGSGPIHLIHSSPERMAAKANLYEALTRHGVRPSDAYFLDDSIH
jgi:3,4-dihydroxy 2-butanone 4-phosphate synthase/GTP cyclohydrolase II